MALFAKKNGPAKVEAAFGLFTKAINDLEAAVEVCYDEEAVYKVAAAVATANANASVVAAKKAKVAVTNLKTLLGG
jgi:hypothetical protein